MSRISMTVAIALFVWGCDRTHMSPHFGEANRSAFGAQVIDADAGTVAKPHPPLDPEEAATIARALTKSLAPPAAGPSHRDPMLLVSPPTPAASAPAMPEPAR